VNPALLQVDRSQRRLLLKAEERNRASGLWGDWETLTFPAGTVGRGWAREFTKAHRNKVFSVLDRDTNGARHLAVSSLSSIRPSWYEMQRIKDELAGEDATAVEVYPPHVEIVDGADMFHIWVLPYRLPFGLSSTLALTQAQRVVDK
jgi:hypothetical protein